MKSKIQNYYKNFGGIYITLICLMFIASYVLIYKMLTGEIVSDYYLHRIQSFDGGMEYSLVGYIFRILYSVGKNYLTAAFFALVISLTPMAVFCLFEQFDIFFNMETSDWLKRFGSILGCIATPIYIPYFFMHFHIGHISMNPWHNSTYTMMKFFAIISLIYYARIIKAHETRDYKITLSYVLYGLFLFLSSWSKPSFALGFLPVVGIFLAVEFIKNIKNSEALKGIVAVGLASIPAGLVIIWQFFMTYRDVSENDSNLMFGISPVFFESKQKAVMKIALTLLVPIVVLVVSKYRDEKKLSIQIWCNFIINLLIGMFLFESGERTFHRNLLWGLDMSNFLLFIYSIYHLIAFIQDLFQELKASPIKIIATVTATFFVIYQGFTGIIYVLAIFVSKIETWGL